MDRNEWINKNILQFQFLFAGFVFTDRLPKHVGQKMKDGKYLYKTKDILQLLGEKADRLVEKGILIDDPQTKEG